MDIEKRRFLKTIGVGSALPFAFNTTSLFASDKRDFTEPFHWARVKFKVTDRVHDLWDVGSYGDQMFLDMLHKYSKLNVDRSMHVASLDHIDEMVKYPFLFMTAEGDFVFNTKHQNNFVEYLQRGGFIFADDCVYGGKDLSNDLFFSAMKSKVEELFGKKMVKLPNDHEIFRCYYKLNGLPYMQGVKHGAHALFLNGRMALFLSPNDMHCGWRSLSRMLRGEKGWFGKTREVQLKNNYNALKMGINILSYSMTQ